MIISRHAKILLPFGGENAKIMSSVFFHQLTAKKSD